MKLKHLLQLRLGFLFSLTTIAMLLGAAGTSYVFHQQQVLASGDLYNVGKIGRTGLEMLGQLDILQRLLSGEKLDLDPESISVGRKALEVFETRLEALEGWHEEAGGGAASDRHRLEGTIEVLSTFFSDYEAGQNLPPSGMLPTLQLLRRHSLELTSRTLDRAVTGYDTSLISIQRIQSWVQVCMILAPIFLLITWILAQSTAIVPAESMVRRLREAISRGGVPLAVDSQHLEELGPLAESYERFVERLTSLLGHIYRTNRDLRGQSGELGRASETVMEGIKRQSGYAGQAVVSLEQFSTIVSDMVRNSTRAHGKAGDAVHAVRSSREMADQTVKSMDGIQRVVEELAASIDMLGRSTERISEVLDFIEDIADQTNLLSLNASIEAARAGERGRGFAVVADEIRNLSEKTSRSAQEIARILGQVQEGTGQAVELVRGSEDQVARGYQSANAAGDTLRQVLGDIQELTGMVAEIVQRSEEEGVSVKELTKHMKASRQVLDDLTDLSSRGLDTARMIREGTGGVERLMERLDIAETRGAIE